MNTLILKAYHTLPNKMTVAKIVLGNLIVAIGIFFYIIPCHLISGGCTGVAMLINHYTHPSISYIVFIINIILFIWGYFYIGRDFAIGTAISTLVYPICLSVLEYFAPHLPYVTFQTNLLNAVFGGVFVGLGVGLVLVNGASSGGTDAIVVSLHKRYSIPLSISSLLVDAIIILSQVMFTEGSLLINGLLFVATSTIFIAVLEHVFN